MDKGTPDKQPRAGEEGKTETHAAGALEFLTQFFRFGYHLHLFPYKIVTSASGDEFLVHTTKLHKVRLRLRLLS